MTAFLFPRPGNVWAEGKKPSTPSQKKSEKPANSDSGVEEGVRKAKKTANDALEKVDQTVHQVYRGITQPSKK